METFTIEEAAAYLKKPVETLRWMRKRKTGPVSAVVMGRITYRRSDLDAYVQKAFDEAEREYAAAANA